MRSRGDDVTEQRFGALHVDGKIVIDEKNCHLPFFFAGAFLQQQQFVDHALVAAEADGIAEESGHRAELAAVGTASTRLDGNDAKRPPALADLLEQGEGGLRHEIELLEIDRLPRNHRILLQ